MTIPIADYQSILSGLKGKIRQARTQASISLNAQMLSLYWEIGNVILAQQKTEGWGAKVIDRLSSDLTSEFSDMKGLSVRNLKYMRAFAEAYPYFGIQSNYLLQNSNNQLNTFVQAELAQKGSNNENGIMQALLAQISWYHHITLLDKVKDTKERLFYIHETVKNGWSRNIMVHQIESALHNRQGQLSNNFSQTIAPIQSELVQQIFKDPYKFEFISLGKEAKERDLEDALTNHIKNFLLELGHGFAFLGRQYKIVLGDKEYYYDLLFYHTKLKRHIIIELKIDEFKPEYKGKMEFYLNLADDHLKQQDDEPSVGLILCKTKDGLVAEYALRDSKKPIGIAEYKITESLPVELKGELPSIEELEVEITKEYDELKSPSEKKLEHLKNLIGKLGKKEEPQKLSDKDYHQIFQEVVVPFKISLEQKLKEFIEWFDEFKILFWVGVQGFQKESDAFNQLTKAPARTMRLEFEFNGFKKAGTKIFSLREEVYFNLNDYKYICSFDAYGQKILWEKFYQHRPTELEINKVQDEFILKIGNNLEEHLKRLDLI